MTEKEKRIVRKAMFNIMGDDGDFHGGIAALANLCGYVYGADKVLKTVKSVSPIVVAARPNSSFSVKRLDKEGV